MPRFHGTLEKIQPKLWMPHLDVFLADELLPKATLLEYIPHMQMIGLSTFSTARAHGLVSILHEIQKLRFCTMIHIHGT